MGPLAHPRCVGLGGGWKQVPPPLDLHAPRPGGLDGLCGACHLVLVLDLSLLPITLSRAKDDNDFPYATALQTTFPDKLPSEAHMLVGALQEQLARSSVLSKLRVGANTSGEHARMCRHTRGFQSAFVSTQLVRCVSPQASPLGCFASALQWTYDDDTQLESSAMRATFMTSRRFALHEILLLAVSTVQFCGLQRPLALCRDISIVLVCLPDHLQMMAFPRGLPSLWVVFAVVAFVLCYSSRGAVLV